MKAKIAALFLTTCLASAASAEVYVVQDSLGDKPIVVQKDDAALAEVPDIGGLPNKGFSYATRYITTATGVRVQRGHVEPGGTIAIHESPNVYVLYVVNGTGKLINVAADHSETSSITYKPDDIIVFEEGTLHHWANGDQPFDFIGFEQYPPKN